MDRIFGMIITYNPDLDQLKKNLLSVKEQVDKLMLFDNASYNYSEIENLCNKMGG